MLSVVIRSRVDGSQAVMKDLSENFGKALGDCKKEVSFLHYRVGINKMYVISSVSDATDITCSFAELKKLFLHKTLKMSNRNCIKLTWKWRQSDATAYIFCVCVASVLLVQLLTSTYRILDSSLSNFKANSNICTTNIPAGPSRLDNEWLLQLLERGLRARKPSHRMCHHVPVNQARPGGPWREPAPRKRQRLRCEAWSWLVARFRTFTNKRGFRCS